MLKVETTTSCVKQRRIRRKDRHKLWVCKDLKGGGLVQVEGHIPGLERLRKHSVSRWIRPEYKSIALVVH
jgi:hypothetical protein